jgi:predicted dehydrogenase
MATQEPSGKFGVLIHGAGWVAGQHAAAFARNPHTEVVAVSSRRLPSAKALVERCGLTGAACYDDLDQALSDPAVDVVCVCTPQHVHCGNVLAAAAAGKHIVIEKPAGNSLDELRAMRDAVRSAGVRTVVSFVLRWNPLFMAIKRLIAEGVLGEVYCVEADYQSYNAAWWGGWEDGRKTSTAVSALAVAGCHALDAMRWFAAPGEHQAADPTEVFAYAGGRRRGKARQYDPMKNAWHDQPPMEYDGLEMVLARFANGVVGKTSVNFECIQPYAFPLSVFGDRGTVKGNRLFAPEANGDQWVEIPGICPDSSDVTHHPFQAQADHFVECLLSGRESHCNLADATKTHEIIFAAQRCYETGAPVSLPIL